jgi:hypothetical protein
MSLGAWISSPDHRGYQLPNDDIGIFLNYQQIARTKSKDEAVKILESLLEDAPGDVLKEQDYLFRAL